MSKSFISFLGLVLILVFGALMLWPRYQELIVVRGEVLQKQMELDQTEDYLSQLEVLVKKLDKYAEEMKRVESALPKSPNLPSFFHWLQGNCAQNGLLLESVGPYKAKLLSEESKLQETEAEFVVKGEFPAFSDLLVALEKSARLAQIVSISFSQPDRELNLAPGEIFSFEVIIKLYSY